MNNLSIDQSLIKRALAEDHANNDITTRAIVPKNKTARAELLVKSSGVIAGIPITEAVFLLPPSSIVFTPHLKDGDLVAPGQVIASLQGSAQTILSRERVALNFLQHCSGIATLTHQFVERTRHTKTKILDTRKTLPGLRALEKYAVRVGGGENHRFHLADMILIKDNHIAVAGSITDAVAKTRATHRKNILLEIETKTLEEVKEALLCHPDRLMLDNMDTDQIRKAIAIVNGMVPVEVSGGVSLENVAAIADLGVDYISVGSLTHSAKALDISLEMYI